MESAAEPILSAAALRRMSAVPTPVYFLIGAERSGTTLLRLMLDHHPQISHGGEFNYAVKHLNADLSEPEADRFAERLQVDRGFCDSGIEFRPELSYGDQVRHFFDGLSGTSAAVRGATVHFHYETLLRWWPEAKFIHLIRDPRDVAPSVIKMGWAGNCWTASEKWVTAERELAEFRANLGAERVLQLRFEDLVCEPVEKLSAICDFLGIEYHADMLRYPEDTSYPAPDASAAARWCKKLAPQDVQLIEARCRELMLERGYELSEHPAVEVTDELLRALRKQDRQATRKGRVDRYGWWLVGNLWLAKKLGAKGWQQRTVQRMIAVDRDFIR